MARSRIALFGASVGLAFALSACPDDEPPCYEGEYVACSCGGGEGFAVCRGGRSLACDCDGGIPGLDASTAPNDAGVDAGDSGASVPSLLPFGASCATNEQCESSLCFSYAKGPKCTRACAADGDCPPSSGKCGGMSVCKVNP